MKLTDYFLPLKKDKPKEAEITSHILMLRSGMCQQSSSGIYSWLPLGKKVLDKIEKITKDEMNASGAIEILMPTIQLLSFGLNQIDIKITVRKCLGLKTEIKKTYCMVLLMKN